MKIDFKNESLFEHFAISTSISKNELFRLFQTKPELRKELPIYIQTINNEQKIFVEELFSTFLDGEKYSLEQFIKDNNENAVDFKKSVAAVVDLVRNFEHAVTILKISGKVFNNLVSNVFTNKDLSCFYHKNCGSAEDVFSAFVESLQKELNNKISSIINSMNSKNVNSLNRIINAISEQTLKNNFINSFISSLSQLFETITIRSEEKQFFTASMSFLENLTDSIFKNEELYPSYKFCCNKLFSNISQNGFEDYKDKTKILNRLKSQDLKPIFEELINASLKYILFENINKNPYQSICFAGEMSESLMEMIENKEIKIENIDILSILICFKNKGEEWYKKYVTSVKAIVEKKSLKSAIFNICFWVYKNPELMKNKILFTNLILHASNFETRIDGFFGYINRVEAKLDRQFGYDDETKMICIKKIIVDKQEEMLDIILDFYAITIISPELVNTFDQIYKLLIKNTSQALERMEKCDSTRNVNLTHKNSMENSYNRNTFRSSSSSGCYIASCVYGSYDCPQVWILRRYRDKNLASSWFGKIFIKIYYAISPILVKLFGKTKWFKAIWKKYLDKKVKKLKTAGYDSTPYNDKKWH